MVCILFGRKLQPGTWVFTENADIHMIILLHQHLRYDFLETFMCSLSCPLPIRKIRFLRFFSQSFLQRIKDRTPRYAKIKALRICHFTFTERLWVTKMVSCRKNWASKNLALTWQNSNWWPSRKSVPFRGVNLPDILRETNTGIAISFLNVVTWHLAHCRFLPETASNDPCNSRCSKKFRGTWFSEWTESQFVRKTKANRYRSYGSNSAGLEKQSPLEIHRLSPEIGSAKSAYSVAES